MFIAMVCRSYKKCKKVHYFSHSIRSFSIRHNVFIRSGVKGDIRNVCFVPCCGRHFKFGYASSASSEVIRNQGLHIPVFNILSHNVNYRINIHCNKTRLVFFHVCRLVEMEFHLND